MLAQKDIAVEAIRKKLVGKKLSYKEIYAIMDEISQKRLGDILATYFVASGYSKGFSKDEIYYLTRAMVETGEKLHFKGIVADKHSIGGVPGGRVTLIVVPIIAAAGFKIPKSSSRAITTSSGTADAMEVLSEVCFEKDKIYEIVNKTNGCIVWGGSFGIAPADDEIIKLEEPLLFESYDKILVSVMAKKVAFGSNHIVIDLPYGKTVKVHRISDAQYLAGKFEYLAERFGIKIKCYINKVDEPAGRGVGPLLEVKDVLRVLEQTEDRPLPLEKKALDLSGMLLELCLLDAGITLKKQIAKKYKNTKEWAKDLLTSGKALLKMKEIIKQQNGDPGILSKKLLPGKFSAAWESDKKGKITLVNNKNITIISKILGAPGDKKAGIYLHKRLGDSIGANDVLFTLYSSTDHKLKEALASVLAFPLFEIGK